MKQASFQYKKILLLCLLIFFSAQAFSWGFYSHRIINKHAIFSLHPKMVGFYKKHIDFITEHSVDPDKISRVNPEEGPRHYLDVENYNSDILETMPSWYKAVEIYSEDSLKNHGVLPWHISQMLYRLTQAFKEEDPYKILIISSRFGHYIADATVPLHTSKYYNGKTPEQRGIHAFWETRIPVIMAQNYNFFVGKAEYIENSNLKAWEILKNTHIQVDTLYSIYEFLMDSLNSDKVFVYDSKGGGVTKKNYSREFVELFEKKSNKMVERNMKRAIYYVASFWYTAWVNAGQPNLDKFVDKDIQKTIKEEDKKLKKELENSNIEERYD